MNRLRRGLKMGTLPVFVVLWAVMMCVLAVRSAQSQDADIRYTMDGIRRQVEANYERTWAGTAPEEKKPVILTYWLGGGLYEYDAAALFRFYDADGQELARSPMAMGCACLPGTGSYSWYLLLDPVLTEEEQLALAQMLRQDSRLGSFFGSAGGMATEDETDERYCRVVGVTDPALEVVYPKTITYVYADRELTLVDSDSDFFAGKELTTLCFDAVKMYSSLVGLHDSPDVLLRRWKEAAEKLERLVADHPPDLNCITVSSDGSTCSPIHQEAVLASVYAYSPLRLTVRELWPTAVCTLLAAVAMALYVDKRQRAAIARERAFTRSAAHELKTPLAILRTHAEALREDIAPEKRKQYLDVVLDESDRMAELTGRLLELSRLESGAALKRETVDLAALVRQVWSPLALELEQKEIALELELEELQTEGDRERLREAADNLASNALRHCPRGGRIRVCLEREQHWACLRVDNDGSAIPAEDLPHLFEPFYRGDKSRSRSSGGTGLGLAIVRAAALAHGGDCSAENREGGVCFLLRLPLTGEAPEKRKGTP